jgi:hypothetical protein
MFPDGNYGFTPADYQYLESRCGTLLSFRFARGHFCGILYKMLGYVKKVLAKTGMSNLCCYYSGCARLSSR